jgi:hypothetical protein
VGSFSCFWEAPIAFVIMCMERWLFESKFERKAMIAAYRSERVEKRECARLPRLLWQGAEERPP